MKIKKFKARNFSEALEMVKQELGGDAVILSNEEKKGLRPYVEITAAVDYDIEPLRKNTQYKNDGSGVSLLLSGKRNIKDGPKKPTAAEEKKMPESRPEKEEPVSGNLDKRLPDNLSGKLSDNLAQEIKAEITKLRETIEGMKNNGYELTLPAKKKMMLNFLKERSVHEEFALRLCEKTRSLDDIPSLVSADIKVREAGTGSKAVMLIGSTGVGKTTTVAKLSANAIREGKRAAIINLDTYRIGAIEQLRIYSRIMGIPLAIASNASELRNSLSNFSKDRDVIFIDTIGRNPMNEAYIKDMREMCQTGVPTEVHLLMSANSDDRFMVEAYKAYRKLPIDYIAFTKVDEAVRFGALYNLMLVYQKPVAYLTTGQTVPNDLEFTTVDKLTNMILSKGSYRC